MVLLLALPLLLGILLGREQKSTHRAWVEPILALSSGLLSAIAATWWLAPQHISVTWFETDFIDYCVGIEAMDNPHVTGPPKRSRAAGLLPYLAARQLGVLNGLALASVISGGIIGAALFTWAHCLAGRMAALFTLGVALCMGPMVAMTRMLNFYPEVIAGLVLGGAGCAAGISRRTPLAMLAGGGGAPICLLVDVRGLVWALVFLAGLLVAALAPAGGWKGRASRLGALVAPVWLSWFGGWLAYPADANSLEQQIDVRPLYASFADFPALGEQLTYPSRFVWGWTSPLDIPRTISWLLTQERTAVPQRYVEWKEQFEFLMPYVTGWGITGLVGLVIAVGILGRGRPWQVLALLVSAAPFAIAWWGTQSVVEPHLRFYAHGLPALAVALGVGGAGLADL
ncbi:MAG: hypothetical protein QGG40_07425, partial [Myxococcota bacterium]|nr:hypothetical protein [Myxococcota bacterium]